MKNNYDIILVASEKDNSTLKKIILQLHCFPDKSNIYIITPASNIENIKQFSNSEINIIDEDTVIPGITFKSLYEYMKKRKVENKTGWYYQQFLKMAMAFNSSISEYYLIWDADTVPFRNFHFFSPKNEMLLNVKHEYNEPYFTTIQNILHLNKCVEQSFIAEHMIIKKEFMKQMINQISNTEEWPYLVLNSISDINLSQSGFSEYETYGTFVTANHNSHIKLRELRCRRDGVSFIGHELSKNTIRYLKLFYHYFTFESKDSNVSKKAKKRIIISNIYNILIPQFLDNIFIKILK